MDKDFVDHRLQLLFDYWLERRQDRPAPLARQVELGDIPRLQPIVDLIEVTHEPLGFRHRFVGAELVGRMGRDATGQTIDSGLYGSAVPEIVETLRTVVETVRPYQRLARQDWSDRRWLTVQSIELPLLDEAGRVCAILRGVTVGVIQPPLAERLFFEPLEIP